MGYNKKYALAYLADFDKKTRTYRAMLAKRLGYTTAKFSLEGKEDIGLAIAIEKGRKSGYVAEESIMKTFHKIKHEK